MKPKRNCGTCKYFVRLRDELGACIWVWPRSAFWVESNTHTPHIVRDYISLCPVWEEKPVG